MTTNATVIRSGNKVPVKIVETFTGTHGKSYTRALTPTGLRIVGQSRLFETKETPATVNAEELTVEAAVAKLKQHWQNK